MAVTIVQLGTRRVPDEGLRIGTVRRPPRGVRKDMHARLDYYDVWLPELAPSEALMKAGRAAADAASWRRFVKRYTAEMNRPESARLLDVLAALSRQTNFSVGCYCEDEQHCHRSVLRELLRKHGAHVR